MNRTWLSAGIVVVCVSAAAALGSVQPPPAASNSTAIGTGQGVQGASSADTAGMSSMSTMHGGSNSMPMGIHGQAVETGISLALSPEQLAAQEKAAENLMLEKPLQPTILPDGTKRFVLTASAFPWRLWNGETVEAWGYNGQVPGPLIRVRVGDKVEIVVHNELPEPTTVHWHGLAVPNSMDGVPDVTQPPIQPGQSFVYRFTVTPQMLGTHYYHSHYDDEFQVDKGLYGPIIVDPANGPAHTDVDALFVIGSWNLTGQEGNEDAFSFDGKPWPLAPQLNVLRGKTVRIRLINASAIEAHAIHLHGYTFKVVAIDGNAVAQPQAQNTVTILPGETMDVEFRANNPGRWMLHCHILDHTMNPGDDVDEMGGLVTFVNVR